MVALRRVMAGSSRARSCWLVRQVLLWLVVALREAVTRCCDGRGGVGASEMSMRPVSWPEVPEQTALVARRALPKGSLAIWLRDELGPVFQDADFIGTFGTRGRPGIAPSLLMLVTVLQFVEQLTDRQAVEAVAGRIDWKYALCLELDDIRTAHRGRDQTAAGSSEPRVLITVFWRSSKLGWSAATWPGCSGPRTTPPTPPHHALVLLAKTPPSHLTTMPLPAISQIRTRNTTGVPGVHFRRMRDAVAISCRSAGGSSRDGSGWVGRWRWRAPPGADGSARTCASDSGRAGESVSALARELGILRETSYTYIRRHPVEEMALLRRCGGPTAAGPVHLGRPCSPGQNPNDLGLHGHVEGGGGSSPRSGRGCGRTSGLPPMGCNRVRRRARPCLRSVLRPVPACASRPRRR